MSTFARDPVDETWFVHAPLRNQPRAVVTAPPPSNIPYLNGVMDSDIERKPNVIWFKETDSDFVRLSKLGGREDLLVQRQVHKPKKEAVSYPIVQWWSDMQYVEPDKTKRPQTHSFQIPAWFAHQDSLTQKEQADACVVRGRSIQNLNNYNYKINDIKEPLKYGQLRNYLNPAKVNHSRRQTNRRH